MLHYSEWQETLLIHSVQPCGPIPTVEDEEGIYPYESYCETSDRPSLRKFRMIAIENSRMKVTVCPDLGGKVHSILDKSSGKQILFDSGTVRPVRILPRMAFISGGIEVSFPVSHTPVQIEPVHASVERIGDRVYIWCGEREVRYGMQWTVEYSLGVDDGYLTQRTTFYNPTPEAHSWMSWSNAALPARADSQFHFPSGNVLRHADVLEEISWDADATYTLADFDRMQGFFWRSADCNAFGMFTPSLGSGLYHIADPSMTPGMKLWLYGIGRDEEWAHLSAARQESYVEIQAGPLLEQADNHKLGPGERHQHTEFWLPASEPMDIRHLKLPDPQLVEADRIPLFGWASRRHTAPWLALQEAYRLGTAGDIPLPPEIEDCSWPPSGMDSLGHALAWAAENDNLQDQAVWRYYLGVWLAGRGRMEESLNLLHTVEADWSYALQGRLLRVTKGDFQASREAFRKISSPAWSLHPQVFIERDLTLAQFGAPALAERQQWFGQVDSLDDDGVVERKAYFLFEQGAIQEAKHILEHYAFGKVHQRYKRSELWARLTTVLGGEYNAVPGRLGEDDLATYGAYRVSDAKQNTTK